MFSPFNSLLKDPVAIAKLFFSTTTKGHSGLSINIDRHILGVVPS